MVKCGTVLHLGYNGQFIADHESDLIVAADVVPDADDTQQLVPMLERAERIVGQDAATTLADKGYASGVQLAEAEKRAANVLVELPILDEGNPFAKSAFRFDPVRDGYHCPQGRFLVPVGRQKAGAANDYERTVYRCDPSGCPVRAECTKQKRGRTVARTPYDDAFARQRLRNEEPQNQLLRPLRKEIIEHHFGRLKGADGFRRFTVRGLPKVRAQWALLGLVLNLRSLLAAWRDGRFLPCTEPGLRADSVR